MSSQDHRLEALETRIRERARTAGGSIDADAAEPFALIGLAAEPVERS